ncbi:FAD-binding protein [Gammaproteobacteria bacterium]|nr:FAD-binding protein [Gammaproteobacteria bacterium]
MKILLVHTKKQSMAALNKLIGAAEQISQEIDLIYIGECDTTAIVGTQQTFHYPKATINQTTISQIIQQHDKNYDYIMTHSDTTAKDFLPYYCGSVRKPMLSDICKIIDPTHFERAIYAGAVREQVTHTNQPIILSIRGIYFEGSTAKSPTTVVQHDIDSNEEPKLMHEAPPQDMMDLSSAEIVVSGGRGIGSKEDFGQLFELAQQFNAAVGASRAAVDAGYVDNSHQVGQTGKIIAPRIYLSFGISGAVQHLSGMKDAQTIIAVDKNPEAPIFTVADYGYCGDLFSAIKILKGKYIIN